MPALVAGVNAGAHYVCKLQTLYRRFACTLGARAAVTPD